MSVVSAGANIVRMVTMPDYEVFGAEIGRMVDAKQLAYGDSFGKSGQMMRILYPKGISLEQMDDALAVVRVIDKLFRIATDRDALGESPWRDIAGYGLLGASGADRQRLARCGITSASVVDLDKLKGVCHGEERGR